MDDKEFRKLRREDLIEIIYQYQRREQRLTQENELLKCQLKDRAIQISEAGSIAQAALALNDVFKAAQKAADQYVFSVKAMADQGQKPAAQPVPAAQAAAPVSPAAEPAPQPVKPAAENPAIKAAPADADLAAAMANVQAPWNQPEERKPEASKQPVQAAAPADPKPQAPAPHAPAPQAPAAQPQRPQGAQPQNGRRKQHPGQHRGPNVPPAPHAPQAPAAPQGQPPRQQPPRKQEPDTDDFIASLKDYLGM